MSNEVTALQLGELTVMLDRARQAAAVLETYD